jgi:hypothetical protein
MEEAASGLSGEARTALLGLLRKLGKQERNDVTKAS